MPTITSPSYTEACTNPAALPGRRNTTRAFPGDGFRVAAAWPVGVMFTFRRVQPDTSMPRSRATATIRVVKDMGGEHHRTLRIARVRNVQRNQRSRPLRIPPVEPGV